MTDRVSLTIVQAVRLLHCEIFFLQGALCLEIHFHLGIGAFRRYDIIYSGLFLLNGMSKIYQLPWNLPYKT